MDFFSKLYSFFIRKGWFILALPPCFGLVSAIAIWATLPHTFFSDYTCSFTIRKFHYTQSQWVLSLKNNSDLAQGSKNIVFHVAHGPWLGRNSERWPVGCARWEMMNEDGVTGYADVLFDGSTQYHLNSQSHSQNYWPKFVCSGSYSPLLGNAFLNFKGNFISQNVSLTDSELTFYSRWSIIGEVLPEFSLRAGMIELHKEQIVLKQVATDLIASHHAWRSSWLLNAHAEQFIDAKGQDFIDWDCNTIIFEAKTRRLVPFAKAVLQVIQRDNHPTVQNDPEMWRQKIIDGIQLIDAKGIHFSLSDRVTYCECEVSDHASQIDLKAQGVGSQIYDLTASVWKNILPVKDTLHWATNSSDIISLQSQNLEPMRVIAIPQI
ncbi:MAG: hypothetical protein FJ161_04735 [Gammaproteobacteria bacterium]|nr:hypothetical protein [Gammaproteobacteria bacterium]